jgi:SOS-response transcriptional repressor LexA
MSETIRPTKKQYELLTFIDEFIRQHGFGPSYRDIMKGCNYTSVSTVALHVNNLVLRGHLRKRGRSSRSLELVEKPAAPAPKIQTTEVKPGDEKWLVEKIDYRFKQCEDSKNLAQSEVDGLYVLVGALKVLGLEGAANSFVARLSVLKKRL